MSVKTVEAGENMMTTHKVEREIGGRVLSIETGKLAIAKLVPPQGSLVLLSSTGNVVVIPMEQISVQSRNARGVHLMALGEDEVVVSVTATGDAEIESE